MKGYYQYAADVRDGKIVVGEFIKQAVERFYVLFERDDIDFRENRADYAIEFISLLRHYTGRHAGKSFTLLPWQEFAVASIYGFYKKDEDGSWCRLVSSVYIEMARKNGKSAFAAALCLYHLIADGESAAEVYLAANSKDQAKVSFTMCRNFVSGLDPKHRYLVSFRDQINFDKTLSFLKVLAADSSKLDGPNPSMFLLDEYHAAKNSGLKDVLQSGQGMRDDPMSIIITTAGFDKLGPCYQFREMCTEVLKGLKEDDTLFALIYALDEGDDWKNEKVWGKSNPNLGVTVKPKYLREQVQKAINSPSEEVDRIVEVNGQNVVGTKRIDVPKILRGPKGTKAETRVVRRGVEEPLDFTIVRDNIPINTVDAAYKVDPSTGYIRVNRFANNTFKEFAEAIDKMGPIDALILDLRGNGGGLMDQAIRMSNYFLPQGSVIVSTEGMKVPSDRIVAPSDGPFKGKVIVLVNETSASASEIVSGALQDWDRGLLIGRRTFGKGLVQRQFPLNDGSAVRLTVARYHTPTGRVIQRPFRYGDREGYYEDFNRRFQTGDSAVKEEVDSTQVYKTLRLGRTVYGGGGITPDIVVEADTSGYTEYWGNLIRKGIINEFVVEYMDKNRAAILAEYPTPDRFVHEYAAGPEVTGELIRAAEQKGIPYDEEQFRKSETDIRTQLKALFAQKLWSVNEFYRVINAEQDPEFAKALEALKNWESFSQGISG